MENDWGSDFNRNPSPPVIDLNYPNLDVNRSKEALLTNQAGELACLRTTAVTPSKLQGSVKAKAIAATEVTGCFIGIQCAVFEGDNTFCIFLPGCLTKGYIISMVVKPTYVVVYIKRKSIEKQVIIFQSRHLSCC